MLDKIFKLLLNNPDVNIQFRVNPILNSLIVTTLTNKYRMSYEIAKEDIENIAINSDDMILDLLKYNISKIKEKQCGVYNTKS